MRIKIYNLDDHIALKPDKFNEPYFRPWEPRLISKLNRSDKYFIIKKKWFSETNSK